MAGLPQNTHLLIFEEVKYDPLLMVETVQQE